MTKTLFDILDSWTLNWDRGIVEITLNQVAESFYEKKKIFYLLEEIWDFLEIMDDPFSFLTEETTIDRFVNLLSKPQNEHAARSVRIDVSESPSFEVSVLNIDEVITQNPDWFTPYEGMTMSEFGAKLVDDSK